MDKDQIKQGVAAVVSLVIFVAGGYVGKHVMNKWAIEEALEKHIVQYNVCKEVDSIDVPWWNPLAEAYDCTAKIERTDGSLIDVSFTAQEYSFGSLADDLGKIRAAGETARNASGMADLNRANRMLDDVDDETEIGDYVIKNLKVIK